MVPMLKAVISVVLISVIVTPLIVMSVRNAEIEGFVKNINLLKAAVRSYYDDTGGYPVHVISSRDPYQKQLTEKVAVPLSSWDGPYLKKELTNPFSSTAYFGVFSSANGHYQFDFDGDGEADTNGVSLVRIDRVTDNEARKISDIIDGDGQDTQGDKAWNKSGRVKRLGVDGNHDHILLIFIAST